MMGLPDLGKIEDLLAASTAATTHLAEAIDRLADATVQQTSAIVWKDERIEAKARAQS